MTRVITYAEAIREAQDICLADDDAVWLMGLGVPDPKGIFGTTVGLQERHPGRVFDMPLSENAMTGVAIGSALMGMRPILTHQRVDFAILSMEQLVNQAAKWHFMFGGRQSVPVVVRMVVGRGWGQGPQHSQSLQAWFAHVPGLRVLMPTTAYDVKGLLIAAVEDNNPVVILEHRWLYGMTGEVPEGRYSVPMGSARVMRSGADVTVVGVSYMALEALRAADLLRAEGIDIEVIDLRSVRPVDWETIMRSVEKTGRLVVADTASQSFGVAGEIVARVVEERMHVLKAAPRRVALPDVPTPSSPALSDHYYPRDVHIVAAVKGTLGRPVDPKSLAIPTTRRLDQPDASFVGPF